MDIDYKHTWRISRRAWYIRFYLWLYRADDRDVSFCKLFWGYALLWLTLPMTLVGRTGFGIGSGAVALREGLASGKVVECRHCAQERPHICHYFAQCSCQHDRHYHDPDLSHHEANCKLRRRRQTLLFDDSLLVTRIPQDSTAAMRFLNGVGDRVAKFLMWLKKPRPRLAKTVQVAGLGVLGLIVPGAIGVLGLFIIEHPGKALTIASYFGIAIVGAVIVCAVLLAGLWFGQVALKPLGRKAKKPGLGFVQMMKIGYASVKSNTCPRVEIED